MPEITNTFRTVTIPAGASSTPEIDLGGDTLLGIQFPAAMTSAALRLRMSPTSGGNYANVQKDEVGGGDYAIAVTPGAYVPLINLAIPKGCRFIKLAGDAEGADRTLTLAAAPV